MGETSQGVMRHCYFFGAAAALLAASVALAQSPEPVFLRDRGDAIRTSIFGTYVRPRELLVHPFWEYYVDDDKEYKPSEFGYSGSGDFRGKYRASEGLIFLAYGFNKYVALEIEAAAIDATLEKSPADGGTMPAEIHASGPGDMQAQLDFRLLEETSGRPEIFGFFETVFPSNKSKPLIGTSDFEYKAGLGLIRGLSFGTITARLAAQTAEGKTELGEWALEYLRRFSPRWRVYAGIEGVQDEIEAIGEVQWHPSPKAFFRLNLGRGLTSKATDWAPDIGVVLSLPLK